MPQVDYLQQQQKNSDLKNNSLSYNVNLSYTCCRLQEQAQRQLKKGGKFEDLSAGECRPSALVERYDNLYTQTRLDAMDELDEVESLDKLDDNGDIKNKILFSVVVVSAMKGLFQNQRLPKLFNTNKIFERSTPR